MGVMNACRYTYQKNFLQLDGEKINEEERNV